jgi:hypothetical protein
MLEFEEWLQSAGTSIRLCRCWRQIMMRHFGRRPTCLAAMAGPLAGMMRPCLKESRVSQLMGLLVEQHVLMEIARDS